MRTLLLSIILISSMAVKAQSLLLPGFTGYAPGIGLGNNWNERLSGIRPDRKWSFSGYSGISTGFALAGLPGTVLAAPLHLQLNRRLNSNYYAFAGVTVAPAYVNFNRSYLFSNAHPAYQPNGLLQSGRFGMYRSAELGLMYVNDAKTFSISGSFSVQSSSYPFFPYEPAPAARKNSVRVLK